MIVPIEPLGQADRSTQNMSGTAGKRSMPMDAYRDGDQLIVQLDLPGVARQSIELKARRIEIGGSQTSGTESAAS